ncbi:fumarase class II [Anaerospora hongkongensis]|uniref:Fumarate hydratase class II n=1 Tax=Anaerospora hongkongensis TaxID=244830 RepID=A0A4R1Q063_9FIRM|nr:class II fumarate hydratase [Anaerospora hongkongensis]TCL38825.1 fumarase class II [Anaerospora hongkongensis]
MDFRVEKDSMGEMKVPADKMWGASTQRSIENFKIGTEKIPDEMVRAFATLKKACTTVNAKQGLIDETRVRAIIQACEEIEQGKLTGNFPLAVWQTGSGTQFNSNVSEVVAFRANQILKENNETVSVHANDHVNLSQSSNDLFPTAMHLVGIDMITNQLLPAMKALQITLTEKSEEYADIVKVGRTHLMDAIPLTLGQEISAWARMLERNIEFIESGVEYLRDIALGGMVLGTGLTTKVGFADMVADELSLLTNFKLRPAKNFFHSLTSKDEITVVHGMLRTLAADLMKIANDIRLLASGPRCGIGEIAVPVNEPGSVIQPGKVNPTQCEALTMVAVQIFGNDVTVGFAASQGILQLNVYMPVIAYNFIQSIRLLADAIQSFNINCAQGITPRKDRIEFFLNQTMMVSTALVPLLGYDKATQIIKTAMNEGITLKEAALATGWVTEAEYDLHMDPNGMISPR